MLIKLYRRYWDGYTSGVFSVGGRTFYTIERPWIPSPDHLGGLNRQSCIPEGEYRMQPYSSERFPNVWSLANEELDVHLWAPKGVLGRSAILIHSGNMVKDVIGCIAVGLSRSTDRRIVLRSGPAIQLLRELLGKKSYTLSIGVQHGSPALKDALVEGPRTTDTSTGGVPTDVGPKDAPT